MQRLNTWKHSSYAECAQRAKEEPLPLEQVCPHHVGDDALVRNAPTRVEEGQVAVAHQQRRGAPITQLAVETQFRRVTTI
jgi:hypothetical protein